MASAGCPKVPGGAFDPESFSVADVNQRLEHLQKRAGKAKLKAAEEP